MGAIDERVYGIDKRNGVLFAFGYGSPDLFNIKFDENSESDDSDQEDYYDEFDDGENVFRQNKTSRRRNIIDNIDPHQMSDFFMIRFPKDTQPIMSVSWGIMHALAITVSGQMYSWGTSQCGALGFRNKDRIYRPTYLPIIQENAETPVIQIACGFNHSMCITHYHQVYSWGWNNNGRLGHDDLIEQNEPKIIESLECEKILKISAGEKHSAWINSNFKLYIWGWAKYGKLGFDSNEDIKTPTVLEDLSYEITDVSWGPMHTIICTSEGKTMSFGHGKHGKLGYGDVEDSYFPTKVAFYNTPQINIVKVFAMHNISVALNYEDWKIYTWGYHGKGILGYVTANNRSQRVPLSIEGIYFDTDRTEVSEMIERGESENRIVLPTKIIDVALGDDNTVILTDSGDLFIVGSDEYGQLGMTPDQK